MILICHSNGLTRGLVSNLATYSILNRRGFDERAFGELRDAQLSKSPIVRARRAPRDSNGAETFPARRAGNVSACSLNSRR
jgi:hypothetical protein